MKRYAQSLPLVSGRNTTRPSSTRTRTQRVSGLNTQRQPRARASLTHESARRMAPGPFECAKVPEENPAVRLTSAMLLPCASAIAFKESNS